jgi:hypothetical protein
MQVFSGVCGMCPWLRGGTLGFKYPVLLTRSPDAGASYWIERQRCGEMMEYALALLRMVT